MLNNDYKKYFENTDLDKQDSKLSLSISFSFFSIFLVNLFNNLSFIETNSPILLIPKMISMLIFLFAIPAFIQRLTLKNTLIILALLFFMIINFYFTTNIGEFRNTFKSFFLMCLPVFLFGLCISNFEKLLKYLVFFAKLSAFLVFSFYLFNLIDMKDKLYLMGFGYSLIFFVLLLIDDFRLNKNKISMISILFLIPFLLVTASRGVFACIISYILLFLYQNIIFRKNIKKTIVLLLSTASIYLLREKLLLYIFLFFERRGIYSRTLNSLVNGTITQSSGREYIYKPIILEIMQEPFKIRGINAEYNLVGIYAHNFILEIIYQFGIIIGIIIIGYLFYLIIKGVSLKKRSRNINSILLCLIATWVPYLLISSSIWVTAYFWLFLGLMVNVSSRIKIYERLSKIGE
ncbi:hypothetical protein ACODH8_08305 [Vagococcus fluvialis]